MFYGTIFESNGALDYLNVRAFVRTCVHASVTLSPVNTLHDIICDTFMKL